MLSVPKPCSRRSFLTAAGLTALSAAALGPHRAAGASALSSALVARQPDVGGQRAASIPAVQAALPAPRPLTLQFLPEDTVAAPDEGLLASIRLFGDMHFGFTDPARLAAVERDLFDLPRPDALLSTGDETHFGLPGEYDLAQSWLQQWQAPFYSVTGNHTFWNWSNQGQESSDILYGRFVDRWGLPMPYVWELGGVRFVGAGATHTGAGTAEASLRLFQV